MALNLFFAQRFYRNSGDGGQRRATSLAVRIATIGVAVGIAVMIVSICVVKGFQAEVRSKLTGFTAHAEVLDLKSFSSPESYPIAADEGTLKSLSSLPDVERVSKVSLKMGIIKTQDAFQTIILKGIDKTYDTTFIKSQIVEGRMPAITGDGKCNEILISKKQAQQMGLKVGSRVYTYFVSDKIKLRRFTVAGLYQTNLSQFDENFVWTDLAVVNKLNSWQQDQCSTIEIYLHDFDQVDAAQGRINQLINGHQDRYGGIYSSLSVKENPHTSNVVQWLTLLDLNVRVILLLMIIVAGFTIVSGLLILILERTQTIGILKSLGATNTRIRHIFMTYALLIVVRGLVWGNIIGLGIVVCQKYFGFVSLDPSTYYVSTAPVEISLGWLAFINAATLLVCLLVLIVPSFVISRIKPAKSIRFE